MRFFKIPQLNIWSALLDLIVVILGILIAFTLNNWWENREINSIEKRLLNDLKIEANVNLAEMDSVFLQIDTSIVSLNKLIELVGPDAEEYPIYEFNLLVSKAMSYVTYDATNTIKELMASQGDIKYIKNHEIKLLLSSLPARLRDYLEDEEFTTTVHNSLVLYLNPKIPRYSAYHRPDHFLVSTKLILQDPEFDSNIGAMLVRQKQLKKELLDYQASILKLINLIETDLNK